MSFNKVYICIKEIPNTIYKPGMEIYLYNYDQGSNLENLLKSRSDYFIVLKI